MINLKQKVYDFLYKKRSFEIDEVYQVFQGNASNIFVEAKIFHPCGSNNEKRVVIEIANGYARVLQTNNSQKEFVEIVNDSNYQ